MLASHTTIDLSPGKAFGEPFSISLSGLTVENRRVMLDNNTIFGGFHLQQSA
jgi:hypothetical protein